jgi:hypothetical protein
VTKRKEKVGDVAQVVGKAADAAFNQDVSDQVARNVINLDGIDYYLTMPKGRAGKTDVVNAQIPYETALKSWQDADSELDMLVAARNLFQTEGFQDEILPFIMKNTTAGEKFTDEQALAFWDENSDSIVNVMVVYLTAMSFFLTGSKAEALKEASGKSDAANSEEEE